MAFEDESLAFDSRSAALKDADAEWQAGGAERLDGRVESQDEGAEWPDGACAACGRVVPPSDLLVLPGPGYDGEGDDLVSKSLVAAHRLLEPIRGR